MITKEELYRIEEDSKQNFIEARRYEIESAIKYASKSQERICEVRYHPLLDSYFAELCKNGFRIESRTLDKITLSW